MDSLNPKDALFDLFPEEKEALESAKTEELIGRIGPVLGSVIEEVKEELYTAIDENIDSLSERIDDISLTEGPRGPKGDKGNKGDRGPEGPPGPRGFPGRTPTKAELKELIPDPLPGKDGTSVSLEEVLGAVMPSIFSRLSYGGGNANRNIAIGGNTSVLSRYTDINYIAGSNVTLSYTNNDTTKYTDITIASSGGGGGTGYQAPTSGVVDGVNTTFTWTTAPKSITVDQGRTMQATSSDGTVNWTGTTTTVLSIAPISDIFSLG